MLISPRNYFNLRAVLFATILSFAGFRTTPIGAYTVVDHDVYYHGGSLQFQILVPDAAYNSQIFLLTDSSSFFIANSKDIGLLVNLADPSIVGLNPGDEFTLGIHVTPTGYYFRMGEGSSNPDGVAHGRVNYLPNHLTLIGFEDVFGGGDFDYNDVQVQVAGDIGVGEIPEPSAMLLFAMGLPLMALLGSRIHLSDRKKA
jgi:uncharacterized protein DUF4114